VRGFSICLVPSPAISHPFGRGAVGGLEWDERLVGIRGKRGGWGDEVRSHSMKGGLRGTVEESERPRVVVLQPPKGEGPKKSAQLPR